MPRRPDARPLNRDCPIQLVCFDIGGVMIEICADWHEASALAGVGLPAAAADPQVLDRVRQISDGYESGRIDSPAFDAGVARLTGLTPAEVAAVATAWLKAPFPDLDALLGRVGRTGVRTACLSNTNRRHWSLMTGRTPGACRIPLERLNHHFVSHEIGAMKPQAAIYEHVESASGVAAERILFFDDAVGNCEAARRRGWKAEQIDPRAGPARQMTEHLERHGVI